MLRYPDNTATNIEDFRRCDWKRAVELPTRDDYYGTWQALSKAASTAVEVGKVSEGKVLTGFWRMRVRCPSIQGLG